MKQAEDVREMLEYARQSEYETIKRYEKRKEQAANLNMTELVVKLEDMIADETNHMEELDRLLNDKALVLN